MKFFFPIGTGSQTAPGASTSSAAAGAGAGAGGARSGAPSSVMNEAEHHSQPALAPGSERRRRAYQGEEEAFSYYSQLAQAPDSAHEAEEVSERGKCDLVHRWLRRKLYEEVHEQVYACSRGLREVVPPGVLELFSAVELQATDFHKSSLQVTLYMRCDRALNFQNCFLCCRACLAERRLCRTRCWRIGRSTVSTVTAFMRRIPKSSGFGRYTHTHMHTCTHAHMHTCTHIHTTLHTHTHTYTPGTGGHVTIGARRRVAFCDR